MRQATPVTALVALAVCIGCGGKAAPQRDFIRENIDRWNAEVQQWGGSWDGWSQSIKPFTDDVRTLLASRPENIPGIVGIDGFLFFRRSLEVLVAGDLRKQEEGKDPFPAIVDFNNQLKARGVDLLFCPIPVKAAVFPEKASPNAPAPGGPFVNPYTRKLMLELSQAGVECVDLLPVFINERNRREAGDDEPFYMIYDTHWSNRALRTAARVFAERIRAYPWYSSAARGRSRYTTAQATSKRRGDIVQMLPEAERVQYRPMTLRAEQVMKADGAFYEDDANSPIVLLGEQLCRRFPSRRLQERRPDRPHSQGNWHTRRTGPRTGDGAERQGEMVQIQGQGGHRRQETGYMGAFRKGPVQL